MIWTIGRIRQLQNRAGEAQGRIRELFINGVIRVDEIGWAWGQFLDEPRDSTQYGIYGTSAGLQVLVASGYPITHEIIKAAGTILSNSFEPDSIFQRGGDLFIVYKIAALAEVTWPEADQIDGECRPMAELMRRTLPGGGWGEYFCSERNYDRHPRIAATAPALLALRRYRPFHSTWQCEDSLRRLCTHMLEDGSLRAYQLALGTLALVEYQGLGVWHLNECKHVLNACGEHLVNWMESRKPEDLGISQFHCYSVPASGGTAGRYLIFLPDCLAALALLKLGCPKRARRYVLQVVRYFSTQIIEKQGFTPGTTGRVSSVDHLWIYRLLQEFKTEPVDSLVPLSYPHRLLTSKPALIAFGIFLLGVSFGGMFVAYNSSLDLLQRVLGGIVSTVCLGLFGRIVWELLRGGNRDRG